MVETRSLSSGDIPAALALSAQANWNHVAADWARCLALNPTGCVGGFENGRLIATCTMIRFGAVGWIGTFLVDQSLRGRGYGKKVFEALLERAREQGIESLGLDASDAGKPIYLKHGFQTTEQGIELWTGPALESAPDAGVAPLRSEHWEPLLAFDLERVKVPREHQLRILAGDTGASARILVEGGRFRGFGFSRPGRLTGAIGPVVAGDAACAFRIVLALMADRRRLDGAKPVGVVLLDNPAAKAWFAEHGFQMRRRNLRMFRPEPRAVLSGEAVFACTGLGMG